MKRFLSDFAAAVLLAACASLGALLMAPPAHAQVTEAAPACNAFTEGVGHVVGRTSTAEGVHWWCAPADPFGNWVPARAARLSGWAAVPEARGAGDVPALVAARTLPTTAPEFAPLWSSMAKQIAASRPAPRWQVAPVAGNTRQAYRITEAGTLSDMGAFRIASGAPCDCTQRVTSGSSTYCQAAFVPRIVALCIRN